MSLGKIELGQSQNNDFEIKFEDGVPRAIALCTLAIFQGAFETATAPVWFVFDWSRYLVVPVVSFPFIVIYHIFSGIISGIQGVQKKEPIDIKKPHVHKLIKEIKEKFEETKRRLEQLKKGDNEDSLMRDLVFRECLIESLCAAGKEKYGPDDELVKELSKLLADIKESRNKFPNWMINEEIPKPSEFIEKKDVPKISHAPVHFENGGNRCYFNSTIQALLATPYFRDWVRNFNPDNWAKRCEKAILQIENDLKTASDMKRKILNEDKDTAVRQYVAGTLMLDLMKELLTKIESRQGGYEAIMNEMRALLFLGEMQSEFKGKDPWTQWDANSVFLTILSLYGQILQQKSVKTTIIGENGKGITFSSLPEVNPLSLIMIGSDQKDTFQNLFNKKFSEQTEEKMVVYEGTQIKSKETTETWIDMNGTAPPEILVVQLDRSTETQRNTEIELKEFKLDFAKAFNSKDSLDYKLVSFVKRIASSNYGGHYISYVCHEDQWWLCDDMSEKRAVEKIATDQVKPENGYMFVFERIQK